MGIWIHRERERKLNTVNTEHVDYLLLFHCPSDPILLAFHDKISTENNKIYDRSFCNKIESHWTNE